MNSLNRPQDAAGASIKANAAQLATLENAAPGRKQRWFAVLLCVLAALVSLTLLPVLGQPMPIIPAFLPLDQSALILAYGLTSWLFLDQFRHRGSVCLLVLGAGSLFTAIMVTAQLLCFPGTLASGILVGQGPATSTWIWNFWHLGPPLFALPYAIMEGDGRPRIVALADIAAVLWKTVLAVALAAVAIIVLVCTDVQALPAVSDPDGGFWSLTTSGIGPGLIGLTGLALGVLCGTTRLRTVLQLWVAVSLVLLLVDNLVTDLAAARGTIGWFLGRVEALLAATVVLSTYLSHVYALHRLAENAAIEREQARHEAAVARDNLEIALEASGMGGWELDLATDLSRRTNRHDQLFGYSEPPAVWGMARFIAHVVPEDRATVEACVTSALRGGALHLECRIRRADTHDVRWIEVHGKTTYNANGIAAGMVGCVADVTERRRTDERLRQSVRLDAIGQLTGGVAHDFNNLLTVVLGSLDLILARAGDAARVEKLAQNALVAGRRGSELTDKLLSFSRRQMVRPETVNLNRQVVDFRGILQRTVGESIDLVMDLEPVLDPVRIDPSQIQAAILNLAVNAAHAMPTGGKLTIETRNVMLADGDVETADLPAGAPAGAYVRLTVRDTGIGMAAATAARAFEPFFTTKEIGKGAGLGLSQVYGFSRQAGGTCRIRSAPGQGCAVEIYLPRSTDAAMIPAAPGNIVPLRTTTGGEVVLIVEDEDVVRDMAAESLTALGYRVLTAPDARVALDVLKGPSRVDILFSDVVMPGGMNGAQLGAEAIRLRPHIKILLTSGYAQTAGGGVRDQTAGGGVRDLPDTVPLLRKPYMRDDLAAKLRLVLNEPAPMRA